MNGRKIKTSRTFYGKSDETDSLTAPRPACFPYGPTQSLTEKNPFCSRENSEPSSQF
jgi:hypothetical protein